MWTKAAAQATRWVILAFGWRSKFRGPGTAWENSGSLTVRKGGSKELGVMLKRDQHEGECNKCLGPSSLEWPFPSAGLVTGGAGAGPFSVPGGAPPGASLSLSRAFCSISGFLQLRPLVSRPDRRRKAGCGLPHRAHQLEGGQGGQTRKGFREAGPRGNLAAGGCAGGCCQSLLLTASFVRLTAALQQGELFQKGSHSHTAKTSMTYS